MQIFPARAKGDDGTRAPGRCWSVGVIKAHGSEKASRADSLSHISRTIAAGATANMNIFIIAIDTELPPDLAGTKLATYGSITEARLEALGAFPVMLPPSELLAALRAGVIDAVAVDNRSDLGAIRQSLRRAGEDPMVTQFGAPAPEPTPGADDLQGSDGTDVVRLLGGADAFEALGGRDRVFGNGGADTISGDAGGDRLVGGGGGDRLVGGIGGDRLVGGAGRDSLSGGAGDDALDGGGGKDTLIGGAGNDILTGGRAADVFVFDTLGERNRDTITDFRKGTDVIRVSDGDYRLARADGDVVLRFAGGESLTLEGVSRKKGLARSIEVVGEGPPDDPPDDTPSGAFVFTARGENGPEVWISDGTAAGTRQLTDVSVNGFDMFYKGPPRFSHLDGEVAFFAYRYSPNDAFSWNAELWTSDETPQRTRPIIELREAAIVSDAVFSSAPLGDQLLFSLDDGLRGAELWVSDGTANGTRLLKDIEPEDSLGSGPNYLTGLGDHVVFAARAHDTTGNELWITDGTTAGTRLLKDIREGIEGSNPRDLLEVDGQVFFHANGTTGGEELWVTDGTERGTRMVADINPGSPRSSGGEFTAFGNGVMFAAQATQFGPPGLFFSDGTERGTRKLTGDDVSVPTRGFGYGMEVAGDKLIFVAETEDHGEEIWVSDGTRKGTHLLADIREGILDSNPYHFTRLDDRVIFTAYNDEVGREIFFTDGTTDGTGLLKDVTPGFSRTPMSDFDVVGGHAYFVVDPGSGSGHQIWRTDGTEAGTRLFLEMEDDRGAWPDNFFPLADPDLDGGAGADRLRGGPGDDDASGGGGDDIMLGRAGRDTLAGGDGDDRLSGGDGNDRLEGDDGDDRLFGEAGEDTLDGQRGDDTMDGGAGADLLVYGRRGGDDVILGLEGGADTVDVSAFDLTLREGLRLVSQDAGGVTLDFGRDGTLRLDGVSIADLSPSDFIL